MFDFISIPLVVGIITYGIYALFELFAHRRERLIMIDKLDKINPSLLNTRIPVPGNTLPGFNPASSSFFKTLRTAALMIGIGIGLLVGFWINSSYPDIMYNNVPRSWDLLSILYGAPVLLFGGLSLIVAFLIELRLRKSAAGRPGHQVPGPTTAGDTE